MMIVSCGKTTEPENPPDKLIFDEWWAQITEQYVGGGNLEIRKKLWFHEDWTYSLSTKYRVFDSVEPPPYESESGNYEIRETSDVYIIDSDNPDTLKSEIAFHPEGKDSYKRGWSLSNQGNTLRLVSPDGHTEEYDHPMRAS
jgi:hypothetical protein